MKKTVFPILFLALLSSITAKAQLFSEGNDPASLSWNQIRTDNYRIVYPRGLDSLAAVYALNLERYRDRVGLTIGYKPNEAYRKPMPVILHPFNAQNNGMVTWAPRRMELFTVPDGSDPLPLPIDVHLAIHESRHVAQMQFGAEKPYRWLNVIAGQLWPGAMAALYPGPAFFEGDAVVAETELTNSGRGRTSSFLNYYDICFSEGDVRDYWKWRYGSQRFYTPDHYRAGYFTIAGIRTLYDDPDFTARYYRNVTKGWPFPFFVFQKTVKQASGKNFRETFSEIAQARKDLWENEAELRKPFTPSVKITEHGRYYSAFSECTVCEDGFYSVLSGLDRASELVKVSPDGDVSVIGPFSSTASHLSYSGSLKRLFWAEIINDPRWELKSSSVIMYRDADGKTGRLTGKDGRYFNPSVGGDRIAAVEYPWTGGSAAVVLDARDGKILGRVPAPDGMQIADLCWLGEKLYFSAVTERGTGIYDLDFNEILAPRPCVTSRLFPHGGRIHFTADRNGSEELYSLDPRDGQVRQLTSSRFGGRFYSFFGDSLYFCSGSRDDFGMYRAAVSDLIDKTVEFGDIRQDSIAEELSSQVPESKEGDKEICVSSPERYSKIAHLFHLHSWLPVYVNYDAVSNLNMQTLASDAGLGATVLFHNDLNSMQGIVGYSAWNRNTGWRHSLHGQFTYSGWYPVIEASFDLNDHEATQYLPQTYYSKFARKESYVKQSLGIPSFRSKVRMYVPLQFPSGGWRRGLIPEVNLSFTNDWFSTGLGNIPMTSATVRLSGYIMRPIASSCIYPRLGIGAEAGYSSYFGLSRFSTPAAYLSFYGYLPGILRTHGIRWDASLQSQSEVSSVLRLRYAFPFAAVDWSFLSPAAYIKNFEFSADGRWQHYYSSGDNTLTLLANLCVRLGNLLWIPYDTRIGVNVSYTPGISKGPECSLAFSVAM